MSLLLLLLLSRALQTFSWAAETEACCCRYWAAPKYEILETRATGFVFQACLEPPASTQYERHLAGVRETLKAVQSEPCGTHKKAKESAAHKILLILNAAGIRT